MLLAVMIAAILLLTYAATAAMRRDEKDIVRRYTLSGHTKGPHPGPERGRRDRRW